MNGEAEEEVEDKADGELELTNHRWLDPRIGRGMNDNEDTERGNESDD